MLKTGRIKPFLWFDDQAEEAVRFYTSIFKNSKIGAIARYPEGSPGPAGKVMTVAFRIEGQDFIALNGGPQFKPVQCGWLKDKFGLSWQVNPGFLGEIFAGKDKARAERVMQVMLKMVKLDIEKLKKA